ncbi:MAG: ABC transporter ATP-binding protein [Deltaproteobacteria bacterium]|nr:ABC transporter ATP-binding protein [Deltaproteobacteria bacterium]
MPIVSTRQLHRTYLQGEGEVHALDGVDLDIEPGEFVALMGASGSGKTTLLNLIGGLDRPTRGEVQVDGHALGALSSGALSRLRLDRIGFVFQAYNLIPVLSARENAEFVLLMRGVPADERRRRVDATLAAVGLEGLGDRLPSALSGGQQQRVAVARAIAGAPALVLADEPTANLDSRTGTELVEMMRRLNTEQGITFVFATHDTKVEERARRVIWMEDGKVQRDERRG